MQPLQIARIVDDSSMSKGDIVMRTASVDNIEIMSLSHPEPDGCYVNLDLKVELLPKAVIVVKLEGED